MSGSVLDEGSLAIANFVSLIIIKYSLLEKEGDAGGDFGVSRAPTVVAL
jgi:hypothetical protein